MLLGLAATICLAGCATPAATGPNGSGTSPSEDALIDPQPADGTITLPPGTALDIGSLRVSTMTQDSAIGADGNFSAMVVSPDPSLAWVLDESDRVVLFGFVQPGASAQTLDARSTAVGLLYFALSAYTLPPEQKAAVVELIEDAPHTQTVAEAIEAALIANPAALADGDAQVLAALEVAQTELASEASAKRVVNNPLAARQPLARTISIVQSDATGLLITPDANTLQSGMQLLQNPSGSGVLVQNTFRRRAEALAYLVGTEDENGTMTEVEPPRLTGDSVRVPSTFRLEFFTSLYNAVTGTAPFSPETSEVLDLPREPGAARTLYEVVVLGPSIDFSGVTTVFDDPRFAAHVDDWNDRIDSLQFETFFMDFMLPVVENLAIGAIAPIPANKQAQAIANVKQLMDPHLAARGIFLTSRGGFVDSVKLALELMRDNVIFRDSLMFTLEQALSNADANKLNIDRMTANLERLRTAAAVVQAIELGMATVDLGAVLKDLAASVPGERWQVTAIPSRVRLEPSTAQVSQQSPSVVLTASVNGEPDGNFYYRWSTSGMNGTLAGTLDGEGTMFVNEENQVQYIADVSAFSQSGEIDTVTIDIFLKENGPPGLSEPPTVGSATASIEAVGDCEPGTLEVAYLVAGPVEIGTHINDLILEYAGRINFVRPMNREGSYSRTADTVNGLEFAAECGETVKIQVTGRSQPNPCHGFFRTDEIWAVQLNADREVVRAVKVGDSFLLCDDQQYSIGQVLHEYTLMMGPPLLAGQ